MEEVGIVLDLAEENDAGDQQVEEDRICVLVVQRKTEALFLVETHALA